MVVGGSLDGGAFIVLDLGSLALLSDLLRSAGFLVLDSSSPRWWIWSCFGFFVLFFFVLFLIFCVSVFVEQRLWVSSDVTVVRFHKPERVLCSGSITRKGCWIINLKGSVTNVLDSPLDLSSYASTLERAFMLAAVSRELLALGFCTVLAVNPFAEYKS